MSALPKAVAPPIVTRPILFSGAMVRAILDDRKTQTRRVASRDPATLSIVWVTGEETLPLGCRYTGWVRECDAPLRLPMACPYGAPGDRLWVRETWAVPPGSEDPSEVVYRADVTPGQEAEARLLARVAPALAGSGRWKPAIHMPRWACRLVLEVTDVRAERLQDISEEDAVAEGIEGPLYVPHRAFKIPSDSKPRFSRAEAAFEALWDSINGKRAGCSWADNPYVWAVSFRRRP